MHPTLKTRFAPSPTGLLHLGNIRTALFNFLLARGRGGVFLLRLEDTDAVRGHEKYASALQEDLTWLGLQWQEGPQAGGTAGPYSQSQRGAIYAKYFDALQARGLAYRCFCTEHELEVSRKTQLAAGRPPRYSGRCRALAPAEVERRLAAGTPATLRFHVADGTRVEFDDQVRGHQVFRTDDIGDFVIRRSDGSPAFFFCNAIDDALMGVSLVMRGEDHLTNTPRQILMLRALGLVEPAYAHIALVVGADGSPLSKRHGSRTVRDLRENGYFPAAIVNYLARLGHTYDAHAYMDLDTLAAHFDVTRLGRAPARYDDAQLLHWQHEAILHVPAEELWRWMGEAVHTRVPETAHTEFLVTVRGNIATPADALRWAQVIFADDWTPGPEAWAQCGAAGAGFFDHALAALAQAGTEFNAFSDELKRRSGAKGKALFAPLRVALSGATDGPEMARLLPLIGVQRAQRRLTHARDHAQ